eukprot:scaffold59128_cov55-Attheya_sp.AAC.2
MVVHLQLALAYSAATTAETTLEQVRSIAKQEYASSHALYSNVNNVQVNASTAESMIVTKYIKSKCLGCGDEGRAYADRNGDIVCPKRNEPGVADSAAKGKSSYAEATKKRRKSNAPKRKFEAMIFKHTKQDMDEDQIEAFFCCKVCGKGLQE